MRSLRVLPLLLNRLTVPDGPGQLGILGAVIGCIAVGFMDYATDHRTTIKMRCRMWDVFPHAPDMPLSKPWRTTVKLILRYWAAGNRAGRGFYLTLKTGSSHKSHQKIRRSEGVKEVEVMHTLKWRNGEMEEERQREGNSSGSSPGQDWSGTSGPSYVHPRDHFNDDPNR